MFRLLRGGVQRAGLVAIALALNACSNDDSEDARPRGPEDFSIAQVGTVSHLATEGGDLQVSCAEPILVWVAPGSASTIASTQDVEGNDLPSIWSPPVDSKSRFELGDFKLAPPNDCGGEVDCGWIELEVTPPADAGSVEPIQYLAAHSVIRVDLPDAIRSWTPGLWTFRIQLIDSTGTPVLSKQSNEPLADELAVNVAQIGACAEAVD